MAVSRSVLTESVWFELIKMVGPRAAWSAVKAGGWRRVMLVEGGPRSGKKYPRLEEKRGSVKKYPRCG